MKTFKDGAEAKAERERLGLTKQQLAELAELHISTVSGAELWSADNWRTSDVSAPRITKALNAEAERQAAQATEPKPPEGVRMWRIDGRDFVSCGDSPPASLIVGSTGNVLTIWEKDTVTSAALRYAADLADYRAAQHAAKAHKLAAVKAAEEAYRAAREASAVACSAECRAWQALHAARKEAGLL